LSVAPFSMTVLPGRHLECPPPHRPPSPPVRGRRCGEFHRWSPRETCLLLPPVPRQHHFLFECRQRCLRLHCILLVSSPVWMWSYRRSSVATWRPLSPSTPPLFDRLSDLQVCGFSFSLPAAAAALTC